ncbi:MAG: mannose-1-phosphate guanylyltransferase/mannose-6-phosphate isomerase [Reyranellaceae bacterium]
MDRPIHPVILSGGSGTRLWPLSRELYPKQMHALAGERTLLQQTVLRAADRSLFAPPILIANDEHRFVIAEQLRQIGIADAAIVLEPMGRNTAPAAAVAALMVARQDPDGLLLLMPSDHVIGDEAAFRRAIAIAARAAAQGRLMTFGIAPDRPETGFGYIRRGPALEGCAGAHEVERFVEKPDRDTAVAWLAEGGYFWNGGIFLFRARDLVEELRAAAPDILDAAGQALAQARRDLDFVRLDRDCFAACPSRSIDYAVMEHTRRAGVVSVDMQWSDLGSWTALWSIGAADGAGNVVQGDALLADTAGSYLRSEEGILIAALGVRDLVVVATRDAVLVAPRERAQDVKLIVETLKARGSTAAVAHRKVFRPWGSYESLDAGPGFQVKRITVLPGQRLSLQRHGRRAEHWVVVRGTARVTQEERVFDLHENQSTYIPPGTRHRLENATGEPLHLIEVQSGAYLGEDDIERFDDVYGRVDK